jgi:protein archease
MPNRMGVIPRSVKEEPRLARRVACSGGGMHRWVDHTSELELHVEASTDSEVVKEATRALTRLLRRRAGRRDGERVTREVTVDADDRAQLLAAWLGELVILAETDAVIPERVRFETLDERGLRARVHGRRGDPPHAVSAVSYHRLAFERTDSGWEATVVLDLQPPAGE